MNKNLELGSNEFIPGFEDALIGAKRGDKLEVKISFPKNYWMKEHAGKPVKFVTDVKNVFKSNLPELNDDFAQKFNLSTLEDLKNAIIKSMFENNSTMTNSIMKQELFDYLDLTISMPLPEAMVLNEEKYLSNNKDSLKLNENLTKKAEKRVKLALILSEIARKEKIVISEQDIRKEISSVIMSMPEKSNEIISFYQKNPTALESLKAKILESKAINFVFENASIKESKIDYEEMQRKYQESIEV